MTRYNRNHQSGFIGILVALITVLIIAGGTYLALHTGPGLGYTPPAPDDFVTPVSSPDDSANTNAVIKIETATTTFNASTSIGVTGTTSVKINASSTATTTRSHGTTTLDTTTEATTSIMTR